MLHYVSTSTAIEQIVDNIGSMSWRIQDTEVETMIKSKLRLLGQWGEWLTAENTKSLGFKFFGSLINLRRNSDVLTHEEPTKEVSRDDMGLHPPSPSYASSSKMYTHMGTMPRTSKKDKILKKSKPKDKIKCKQSQSVSVDHVEESLLLQVLVVPESTDFKSHIQSQKLPPVLTLGEREKKQAEDRKIPDAPNAGLPCLSQESMVQPMVPKKRLKEKVISLKNAEAVSLMEQKTSLENANGGSNLIMDTREEQLNTTKSEEYVEVRQIQLELSQIWALEHIRIWPLELGWVWPLELSQIWALELGSLAELDLTSRVELDLASGYELDLGSRTRSDLAFRVEPDLTSGAELNIVFKPGLDLGTEAELDLTSRVQPDMTSGTGPDLDFIWPLELGTELDQCSGAQPDLTTSVEPDLTSGDGPDLSFGAITFSMWSGDHRCICRIETRHSPPSIVWSPGGGGGWGLDACKHLSLFYIPPSTPRILPHPLLSSKSDEVIPASAVKHRKRWSESKRQWNCAGEGHDPGLIEDSRGGRAEQRRTGAMTERCSLWSALSAAACCFYRGSFMQVQSHHGDSLTLQDNPSLVSQPPSEIARLASSSHHVAVCKDTH
ncbi:hypothetical protein DNTS_026689 [Danionella cerebrum]|uniref:Uncharacterized protein n=1 Tax=Danionella cerebrum TaxID=2873325 RepID=A0A553P8Z4_9TELE|nr:hypothetical protein DNTS_026689 [Danionella translucida]